MPGLDAMPDLDTAEGMMRIGREVSRQSTMIGYVDGFILFSIVAAAAIPLVALVRTRKPDAA